MIMNRKYLQLYEFIRSKILQSAKLQAYFETVFLNWEGVCPVILLKVVLKVVLRIEALLQVQLQPKV